MHVFRAGAERQYGTAPQPFPFGTINPNAKRARKAPYKRAVEGSGQAAATRLPRDQGRKASTVAAKTQRRAVHCLDVAGHADVLCFGRGITAARRSRAVRSQPPMPRGTTPPRLSEERQPHDVAPAIILSASSCVLFSRGRHCLGPRQSSRSRA